MPNHSHHLELFDPKKACSLTVIGLGAIGSVVVESFARVGFDDITAIDHDSVSSHNVPMSAYGIHDVGFLKAQKLHDRVLELTGIEIKIKSEKYQGEKLSSKVVISCVDDMDPRKEMWQNVQDRTSIELFCDSRLAGAYVEILTVRPGAEVDKDRYNALLCDQKDTVRQTCGKHGIIYASLYAGSVLVANVLEYLESGVVRKWRDARRCDTLSQVF